ncbi:MAG: ERF family protein [Prevotella sp.]|nr:ERF family protein [Prevotella sp.]
MADTTSRVSKNAKGYGYKYTDMASIHEWLDENGYRYFQEIIPEERGGEVVEYIWTTPIINGEEKRAIRGCRVFSVALDRKSNVAQEMGSGLTYARRYSLLMAFGLACEDDDAAAFTKEKNESPKQEAPKKAAPKKVAPQKAEGPVEYITGEQAEEIATLIDWSGADVDSFLKYFKISDIFKMQKSDYEPAVQMLNKKIERLAQQEAELPEAMRG